MFKTNNVTQFKSLIAVTFLFSACNAAHSNLRMRNIAESKVKELSGIPEGLRVDISPNPARPTKVLDEAGARPNSFHYEFPVRVNISQARKKSLKIVEYNVFRWTDGSHWEAFDPLGSAMALGSSDFERNFSCKDANLEPDKIYTFDTLAEGSDDASKPEVFMWYFVAVDSEGKAYKGEARVLLDIGN